MTPSSTLPASTDGARPVRSRRRNFAWALTLAATALVIFGAKTMLIAKWGSSTPFWDQWEAEAAGLYQPYPEWTAFAPAVLLAT